MSHVIFGVVCALVIGIFSWCAESSFLELSSPHAEDSYYNLLVQGFQSGHLSVKRNAPAGLTKLADPYDPAANAPFVWDTHYQSYELSYYRGKLYLYFGVTPAVVLFWPYAALTGHYLLHREAVVIFFALGFLVTAGLIRAIWLRYFAETSIWVPAAGLLAMGLATGLLETLAHCDVYEVAISCGFAFTMLALAAVWRALHTPKQQVLWLILASLAYGLAVGARPSLLFGIIILLIPVARAWLSATGMGSCRRAGWLFVAAAGPAMLIGLGLMLYNDLRFDNPFEFGWHYQLTDTRNTAARQFSLQYIWINLWFYFLEPIRWVGHFPFLHAGQPPHLPSQYYGTAEPYCGILCNCPLVWLALAAPFAFRGRAGGEASALGWFALAANLLFLICAATLCLFFCGSCSYVVDFLPALMLLAVVGILGLERALAGSPVWRRAARSGWCLLLAYSVVFNLLASVKIQAQNNYIVGNSFFHAGRMEEAAKHFEKAVALDPESAAFQVGLGNADAKNGRLNEAVAHYQKALELEPTSPDAHYNFGMVLIQAGRLDEALVHFQKALASQPNFVAAQDPASNNNLAWSLATDPESSHRNGAIAVMFAEGACRKTHYQTTTIVGTLAAAYAEAGRFDDAIATAQKAVTLARHNGELDLLQNNQKLLALYLKHQPYHEGKAKPGP